MKPKTKMEMDGDNTMLVVEDGAFIGEILTKLVDTEYTVSYTVAGKIAGSGVLRSWGSGYLRMVAKSKSCGIPPFLFCPLDVEGISLNDSGEYHLMIS